MIQVPVADGIKRPEELINMAQDTSRKPFVAKGAKQSSASSNENKVCLRRYINT